MNLQKLLLSLWVTIVLSIQQTSSQGYNYSPPSSGGYNYPRPGNPLLYPGENDASGRSKVIYGTPEDNKDSDLILERNKTSTSSKTTSSSGGSKSSSSSSSKSRGSVSSSKATPTERVVERERVVQEEVVEKGGPRTTRFTSFRSFGSTLGTSRASVPVRRRVVYVEPPAQTVVRRRIIYRRPVEVDAIGGASTISRTRSSSSSSSNIGSSNYGTGGGEQVIRRRIYITSAAPRGIAGSRVIERTRYIDRAGNSISDMDYVEKPHYDSTGSYRFRYRSNNRGSGGASSNGRTIVNSHSSSSSRSSSRSKTGSTGDEEVNYDDRESGVTREEALNRGVNVENIQDVRDRVNNEVVREEVVEERQRFVEGQGENNNGGTEEQRFVEGGGGAEGGFTESGSSSTFTRRRTNFRSNDRRDDRGRGDNRRGNRGSSTNIRETVQRTSSRSRSGGNTNRDIANKAYGIGSGNDESISGSSTRSRLLEQSFRKDVKAPSYGGLDDDDDDVNVRRSNNRDSNNFRASSTTIRKSVSSAGGRSYSNIADDDDGDEGNVIIRKTTTRTIRTENQSPESVENERGIDSSQVIEGGAFAASNNDQVINKGSSRSRTSTFRSSSKSSSGGGKYYGLKGDDSDGSGSVQTFRVTTFTSGSSEGRRRHRPQRSRLEDDDSFTSASETRNFRASGRNRQSNERSRLPSNYRKLMTGTPDEVAAMTGATYMYTRAAPICPDGGCVLSALTSSSRGGGSEYKSASTSSFSKFRAPKHFEHL